MNLFIIGGIIGPWQIILVVLVVIIFFGGRKIPELMKGLGQGLSEFKKATKEGQEKAKKEEENKELEDKEEK